MGKRRKNIPEEPKAETRKQTRVRLSVQRRNRRITMIVGGVLALALILVLAGVISEMVIKPNSVLARVEGRPIITRDFWERTRLRQGELQNQLQQYQIFSAQFGDQNIFASQIAQLQATLSSPLSLGTQVLNQMIDEQVIRIRAEELGITVSDAEVDEALLEEIARGQGAVTVPEATATAEAGAGATATALLFTPTPAPTAVVTDTETLTDADAVLDTEEPATPESPTILTDELYQQGLTTLGDRLRQQAGISVDDYREIIRTQLLAEKLQEQIGQERVAATEDQIEVRHILIRFDETAAITPTEEITQTEEITESEDAVEDAVEEPVAETETVTETLTAAETVTGIETVTETVTLTVTQPITLTDPVTATEAVTDTETVTDEEPVTETETVADSEVEADSEIVAEESRDEAAALAFAQELRERILAGEDFAQLAALYSEDPGSGMDGGNLGWVGRGAFVPEFEEAAFALPISEISEPIRTQFGYHLIEVVNRDENRPKDENQLQQERTQAFSAWLQEQTLSLNIERPTDLPSRLPAGL